MTINRLSAIDLLDTLALNDDRFDAAMRELIISPADTPDAPPSMIATIRRLLKTAEHDTPTQFADMLLNLSICPMHRHDYAICFDDQLDACSAIRAEHPNFDI